MGRSTKGPDERFWSKVHIRRKDQCWEWKTGDGRSYPNFWNGKRQIGANRYALERKLGRRLKTHEFACHTCDNKKCVNPRHLFLGSSKANSEDMVRKGRKEKGEQVHGAKLTPKKVLRIRQLYADGKNAIEIAPLFGVTLDNVLAVVRGKTWKHVGGPIGTRPRGARKGVKQWWH